MDNVDGEIIRDFWCYSLKMEEEVVLRDWGESRSMGLAETEGGKDGWRRVVAGGPESLPGCV